MTTITYAQSDGMPYDAIDIASIERTREQYLTGKAFTFAARSYASVLQRYDWVACDREDYARTIETLGRMARLSDPMARLAAGIIGRGVPLCQTYHELQARVFASAAEALAGGYRDAVGMSGPEAGRRRDLERDYTLEERLALYLWLRKAVGTDSSPGWCADALRRAYPSRLYPTS